MTIKFNINLRKFMAAKEKEKYRKKNIMKSHLLTPKARNLFA